MHIKMYSDINRIRGLTLFPDPDNNLCLPVARIHC